MLTAPQKLMQLIVFKAIGERIEDAGAIAARYVEIQDEPDKFECELQDVENEIRGGEHTTDLGTQYSRHYETRAVAAKMLDGSYVGWTYFYGGGKHGEPGSVEWIDDAYDLTMTEETVTEIRMKFAKVEPEGK